MLYGQLTLNIGGECNVADCKLNDYILLCLSIHTSRLTIQPHGSAINPTHASLLRLGHSNTAPAWLMCRLPSHTSGPQPASQKIKKIWAE